MEGGFVPDLQAAAVGPPKGTTAARSRQRAGLVSAHGPSGAEGVVSTRPDSPWEGVGAGETPPEPDSELGRWARRWAVAGLLATLALAAGLTWASSLPALDTLILPIFLILLPVLSTIQVPFVGEEDLERMSVYAGSSLTILALGAVSLLMGLRLEDFSGLGLGPVDPATFLLWTLGLTGAGVALMEGFHRAGSRESGILKRLLPRTGRERRAFVGVSFSAGIGEELAYRGYVLVALQAAGVGPWAAAGLSSVAFGFLHSYQGGIGVVRTGFLGMGLAASFIMTGSLWPAMAAHTLIDLLGGLVLGERYSADAPNASKA